MIGGSGADVLDGGTGNDWLDAGSGDEWDDDTLYGREGDDTLSGGYGKDRLYGGAGDDVLVGGHTEPVPGDIRGNSDGDVLSGGEGNDALIGSGVSDALYGGAGNDTVLGGDGGDRFFGDWGADLLDGGESIDTIDYRGSTAGVMVNLATGTGRGGFAEGDVIRNIEEVRGTAFSDAIYGHAGDNDLYGYAGNDFLSGGAGADELLGGEGNDGLNGGTGDDTLTGGSGMDQIDGGEGTDTIDFFSFSVINQGVVVDMAAGTASGGEAGTGETFRNVGNMDATPYDDVLRGDANDNVFNTNGGTDQIDGGEGTDTAIFKSGASVFDTGLIVDLTAGTVADGYSDGSTLTNIENVTGGLSGDILRGDANDNVLYGIAGADTISGGAGNDTIIGGIGAYFTNNFAPAASNSRNSSERYPQRRPRGRCLCLHGNAGQ